MHPWTGVDEVGGMSSRREEEEVDVTSELLGLVEGRKQNMSEGKKTRLSELLY